jgi:hypothetical protein
MKIETLDSPEKTEAERRRAAADAKASESHEKKIEVAQAAFDAELRTWKLSRREYRELTAAVKREAQPDELAILAMAAGVPEMVGELCTQRRRALRLLDVADKFDAAKKRLDELDQQLKKSTRNTRLQKINMRATKFSPNSGRLRSGGEWRRASWSRPTLRSDGLRVRRRPA